MSIKELHKSFLASDGICTDTRKLVPGTIFFALKGETFDGNEFAQKAIEAGCLLAVVDDSIYETDGCVLVDNVQETLQELARYHRRQFQIPVIAITGSNGKTTSKELMAVVLAKEYKVLFTEGNLNNHLGVPLTLLRLNEEHEIAIVEMGASRPGDIRGLCEIAEPTCGVITNIGLAHIEGFGSLEAVVETKTELYRYLNAQKGAVIFHHADDSLLTEQLPNGPAVFSYGVSKGDVQGELLTLSPFVQFRWTYRKYQSADLSTQLVGKYNFINFLLAAAVGTYFDVSLDEIGAAVSGYTPSNNRSQVTKTERNTLIVDCYNANGSSMMAALESFSEMDHPNKLAILGDMLELGSVSEETHRKVIAFLQEKKITALLTGKIFSRIDSGFRAYPDTGSLTAAEDLGAIENSLILLKGSRGIKLEVLVEAL